MRGKKGNDTYFVNHAKDRVVEKAKGENDAVRSSIDHVLSKRVESLFLTGKKNLKGYVNRGNNYLTGNSGKNVLVGKAGRDTMSGLGGRDRFVYRSIKDSGDGKNKRDVITDFNGKKGEKIDLLALDANPKKQGNQSLSFIGSRSFSGNRGEVRFYSGILQVNTGSDKRSDMDIELKGVTFFSKSFLFL